MESQGLVRFFSLLPVVIIVILSLNISKVSLRKHPFLLALRRWGRFKRRNGCFRSLIESQGVVCVRVVFS